MGSGSEQFGIKSFTSLYAWQESHSLVLSIYQISKKFPPDERYCLVDQIRRAAVSITSNLAEGFSRFSKKEKIQFYRIALGSLTEVQNQLLLAKDLYYVSEEDFIVISNQTVVVSKLINGLIKSINS